VNVCVHYPVRLHGVVFSYVRIGTTVSFNNGRNNEIYASISDLDGPVCLSRVTNISGTIRLTSAHLPRTNVCAVTLNHMACGCKRLGSE
jgi:hypothetical protein